MLNIELNKEHEWVPGYEGLYSATREGKIYSHSRLIDHPKAGKTLLKGRWLKENNNHRYFNCALRRGKDDVWNTNFHRVIALTFIPNPEGLEVVNHKDGNRHNNHVDNLEWCTSSDNAIHSVHVLGNKPNIKGLKNQKFG